jgi:hypothetical protein
MDQFPARGRFNMPLKTKPRAALHRTRVRVNSQSPFRLLLLSRQLPIRDWPAVVAALAYPRPPLQIRDRTSTGRPYNEMAAIMIEED